MKRTAKWILENIKEGEVYKNNILAIKEISKSDGVIHFRQKNNNNSLPFKMDDEYEKVQQPVDFITAVKSNKKIKTDYEGMNYMYVDDVMDFLSCYGSGIVSDIVLNGQWYIKED